MGQQGQPGRFHGTRIGRELTRGIAPGSRQRAERGSGQRAYHLLTIFIFLRTIAHQRTRQGVDRGMGDPVDLPHLVDEPQGHEAPAGAGRIGHTRGRADCLQRGEGNRHPFREEGCGPELRALCRGQGIPIGGERNPPEEFLGCIRLRGRLP